ncbi:unnamed protein product [Adineta ricciae]|uniref:Serine hydrolase domain-containing protein n=1 Tax=Adineta ricciae TaxID=249248 RepID=A0A813MM43_ADIRI|nr:unnamed protein product [Adineta ricciae]CAF1586774.1 unnamed protein product [Adineta ricciae]
MLLEKILFPAPNPSHYTLTSHEEHLLWIPSKNYSNETPAIPCMLYSPSHEARAFIIWCHGNGCDIGSMDTTFTALSLRLRVHILAFEYPSYGLLKGITSTPSETSINKHAQCAYSFVRDTLKWPTNRIIIYGHSIGSGAACHLSAEQEVGALILQSPYTSISNLIREKIGVLSSIISSSFWNNYEAMKHIACPTLFIHGERDNLIPSQHSQTLYDSFKSTGNKELVLLPDDDHNSISDPILNINIKPFIDKYFESTTESMPEVRIDPALRQPPTIDSTSNSTPWRLPTLSSVTNASKSMFNSLSGKPKDDKD